MVDVIQIIVTESKEREQLKADEEHTHSNNVSAMFNTENLVILFQYCTVNNNNNTNKKHLNIPKTS